MHANGTTARPAARAGFTLIELIAVMGIILTMSLVVVGSYVGITRAIAARAGVNHIRNALLLARQHACLDGHRTYFYVLNDTEYVIARLGGRITQKQGQNADGDTILIDEYSDLGSYISEFNTAQTGGLRLYDFDIKNPGAAANRRPFVEVTGLNPRPDGGYQILVRRATRQSVDPTSSYVFQPGHAYGIALYSVRALPRGFVFGNWPDYLYFEPSGASGPVSPKAIPFFEEIFEGVASKQQRITVKDGKLIVTTAGTED